MINKDVKKVLVIGSGPIVIGQAAEFDYAVHRPAALLEKKAWKLFLSTAIHPQS